MTVKQPVEPQAPLQWSEIIGYIEKSVTIPQLAQLVGCTKETLYALKRDGENGTNEPRHALGSRILSVHGRQKAIEARKRSAKAKAMQS